MSDLTFPVPVKIVVEPRRSARIALRKKQIILRLPKAMSAAQKKQVTADLLQWAKKTIAEKDIYQPENVDRYEHGKTITILGKEYLVQHKFNLSNKSTLHLSKDGVLTISLPLQLETDAEVRRDGVKKLMIQGLSKLFLPEVRQRVIDLNREHFNAEITRVSLRYTTSRWGSCSSNGSISLSSKLLLTPPIVCDYVIIHELAHRFEMNHSHRFWALVDHAMPDYKLHLGWLKTQGKNIDF